MNHPYRPAVKICGIANEEDASLSVGLGADMIGVILDRRSPRHGNRKLIDRIVDMGGKPCAVYTSGEQFRGRELNEAVAQLHYEYSEEDADYLRGHGISLIGVSAYSITDDVPGRAETLLETNLDYVLVDFSDGALNHTGELKAFAGNRKIGYAGRINAEGLDELLRFGPGLIDASSALESSPGKKDEQKVRSFFSKLEDFCNVSAG